jgi:hypothetical protein
MKDESGASRIAPQPMEGQGTYNRDSRVQAAGLSPALPLFERAARLAPLHDGCEPIVIADYGASEGKNSLGPIRAAIDVLRSRTGAGRAISVVHTDLPGNDFTALFKALAGPETYARDSAVFSFAVGRSFYQQILPAASVTLGWSSWAVQWLSRIPGAIPDHIQIAYSQDAAARARYARQAGDDWRAFLTSRGRELRAGARLVVVTMALDDEGRFGYRPLLDAAIEALAGMVADGFLRADEVRAMAIPTVARSRADLVAPFADGDFAGLAIDEVSVFDADDQLWANYERTRDAGAFGDGWSAFMRASVFPTLAAELDGGSADPRAAEFVGRLERDIARRLEAAPHPMLIPLAKIALVKGTDQG